jgi:DNA-binding MarR family transcriptional regulator
VDTILRKKWRPLEAEQGPLAAAQAPSPAAEPMFDLIELFFFAYRDFVADADHLLEDYGLGRAHHRVLHFVNRRPGLTIAELLDILKITKQSLGRVLKELLEQDYIDAVPGANDRRQRHLHPTGRGRILAMEVARLQSTRFARVLAQMPEGARAGAAEFLLAMVDARERDKVAALVASGWPKTGHATGHAPGSGTGHAPGSGTGSGAGP